MMPKDKQELLDEINELANEIDAIREKHQLIKEIADLIKELDDLKEQLEDTLKKLQKTPSADLLFPIPLTWFKPWKIGDTPAVACFCTGACANSACPNRSQITTTSENINATFSPLG